MEISFSSNSTTDDHIATTFGTCHDSTAVVPCAKYCSDHFISIWMRAKWNFHHIWNVMEKLLVKWAPGHNWSIAKHNITQRRINCGCHDDVITWKHFPRYWSFVRGIHRSPVNSPQKLVMRSFDVFFDLRLNKRLSQQSWGWCFERLSRSLWRHCNDSYV